MGQPGGLHPRLSKAGRLGWLCVISLLATRLPAEASPVVQTINGTPLTITIGDDTSMQVSDTNLGGGFDFFPPADFCGTADSGVVVVFVGGLLNGVVYAPAFSSHGCGTEVPDSYLPWTPVSISPVTGSGTSANPFKVVVVVEAGATGLQLTESLTYVNGSTAIHPTFQFSSTDASPVTWNTFLAGDASPIGGFGIAQGNSPGIQMAGHIGAPFPVCGETFPYYVLFPAANRYSSNPPAQVWNEIFSGSLSNTAYFGCPDIAVATEWEGSTLNTGQSLTLNAGGTIEFNPRSRFATTPIPALSRKGFAYLLIGLAAVGWLLSRGTV